jgi:hypothetical protein
MYRFTSAVLIGILAILTIATTASAARVWCARDPIVTLNGVTYQLIVSVPEENVPQVDGELLFEIYSPKGTDRQLIFMDEGFNGYGEKVDFKEHSASYKHTFFVKAPKNGDDFPMLVDLYRDGVKVASVEGVTTGVTIEDPIVTGALDDQATLRLNLGGVNYQVVVTAPLANLPAVDGNLFFEVSSPKNVKQQRSSTEPGFNGYGQQVEFKRHGSTTTHAIRLTVPKNNDDFPVTLQVYRDGALVGTASGSTSGVSVSFPR